MEYELFKGTAEEAMGRFPYPLAARRLHELQTELNKVEPLIKCEVEWDPEQGLRLWTFDRYFQPWPRVQDYKLTDKQLGYDDFATKTAASLVKYWQGRREKHEAAGRGRHNPPLGS